MAYRKDSKDKKNDSREGVKVGGSMKNDFVWIAEIVGIAIIVLFLTGCSTEQSIVVQPEEVVADSVPVEVPAQTEVTVDIGCLSTWNENGEKIEMKNCAEGCGESGMVSISRDFDTGVKTNCCEICLSDDVKQTECQEGLEKCDAIVNEDGSFSSPCQMLKVETEIKTIPDSNVEEVTAGYYKSSSKDYYAKNRLFCCEYGCE